MTGLVLGCLWVVAAASIAMLPRRRHWAGAYLLIATGIPLVGLITWQSGPLAGMLALAAGVSVLRWPVFYMGRWLRGRLSREG
ncbi:DUF2484 family protein [Alkalilacustris brevis]|uniref:DUF2484 family protein n=1 Tax=Alkalilacustris brevis TaxID=2026338 RepID=UPI000E0DF069|nr:DUF2484 family protein [Alkalilacustris brevis]